jgi:integrase/recombinase XerD
MENEIKLFLKYLAGEKKYSSNTLAAYHGDLMQLASFIKTDNVLSPNSTRSISNELLSHYMRSLGEKKYALSTVARKVAAAKSFVKYMMEKGRVSGNLTAQLASPHVKKALPMHLSVSEVRRFLAEPAKLTTAEGRRDRAMLELLYATGLRASELMSLNTEDIDIKKLTVRCRGSNSKVRYVPIDTVIARIIEEYIRDIRPRLLSNESEVALILNRRGERLTRQGFWQIIQGYADKAGLSDSVTPRSLRHSFAAHKLNSGADIESVQELLGHTHKSTTKVYKDMAIR